MSKFIGNNLPDMPWQEKPAGEHMPVWRYDQNPIIGRYEQKRSNYTFLCFRCLSHCRMAGHFAEKKIADICVRCW